MSKFRFDMSSVVVEARGMEEALQAVASHISTVARQQASGVEDVAPEFTIEQVDDDAKAVDLTDNSHGPIELDLDPKSPAGVAMVEQKAREKTEREARQAARANEGKSDAEIMAEHSAKEQASLNG